MKAMKKILSSALSLGVILSTVSGITSNAMVNFHHRDSDYYQEMFAGCTEFDDGGYLSVFAEWDDYKAYYNDEESRLLIDRYNMDYFYYEVPDDENALTALDMAKQFSPEWQVMFGSDKGVRCVTVYMSTGSDQEKYAKASEFAKKLKEVADVVEFKYIADISFPRAIPIDFKVLKYEIYPDFEETPELLVELKELKEKLDEFVESHALDYTVQYETEAYLYRDGEHQIVTLTPNNKTTIEERFKVMNEIYEELGLRVICGPMPTSSVSSDPSMGIEMCSNVDGDANCDCEMTIADATAILQSLGNPDKYGLSAQGKYNADVDNGTNGITTEDALVIQKALSIYPET